jgi:hypothetical protein
MPRVRTVAKHVTELTKKEIGVLRRLNFGDNGSMRYRFDNCLLDNTGWAVIHYSKTGAIDGWSLVFDDDYVMSGGHVAYFYVSGSNRGRGIGTALMRHVRIIEPTPLVYPHDKISFRFFVKHPDLRTTHWGEWNEKLVKEGKNARFARRGEKMVRRSV